MSKQSIRITFSEKETEDLKFLMADRRKDTPHDLVRLLVAESASALRELFLKYGPNAALDVHRPNIADRRRELEKQNDEVVTVKLKEVGLLEPAGWHDAEQINGYDTSIGVGGDGVRRVLLWNLHKDRFDNITRTLGGQGDTLETVLNRGEKKKLL